MSEDRQRAVSEPPGGVRVGCAGLPPGLTRSEVFEIVSVLEEHGLTREPLPSAKALRRWRRDTPDDAGFALVCPAALFDRGAAGEAAVETVRTAVEALDPEVLLLRPAASLAPSQTSRDRLRTLVASELCPSGELVFWPTGLWDAEISRSIADELEIAVAINPLANDPQDLDRALWERELERGVAYLRLERLAGARRRFDDYELDEIAELVEELTRGWVIFSHAEALRDAHALRGKLG